MEAMDQPSRATAGRSALPGAAPPPTASRKLPAGVLANEDDRTKMWFGTLVLLLVLLEGIGFEVGPSDKIFWLSLSPLIAATIYSIWSIGSAFAGRSSRRRIYRTGIPAVATVKRAQKVVYPQEDGSRTTAVRIQWEFFVEGLAVGGERLSKGAAIGEIEEGDLIWVLYDPQDPAGNVEWPPL